MSGRRTRAARLAGVAATVALVAGSSVAAADPGAGYRAKAQRLNVQAQNLDTRTHRALLDLYALESQLGTARTRLAALEARSQRLRTRRQALSQQLAAARQTLAVSEQNLAAHLRALYEQGTADPLAVVLGAQSLSDALAKLDGLSHIAAENRRMVAVTRQAKATLAH
ncbi:MAG: PcsB-like coiled-coil domain-containing protein, partial [Gaiellaceae bacterium]